MNENGDNLVDRIHVIRKFRVSGSGNGIQKEIRSQSEHQLEHQAGNQSGHQIGHQVGHQIGPQQTVACNLCRVVEAVGDVVALETSGAEPELLSTTIVL